MHAEMKAQGKTRGEQVRGRLRVPHLTAGQYIWRAFEEMGICQLGSFGIAPLTWAEIHAFSALSDGEIGPWEARIIRKLSAAYCDWRRRGEDPLAIPPWEGD